MLVAVELVCHGEHGAVHVPRPHVEAQPHHLSGQHLLQRVLQAPPHVAAV